jgi:hypothetical protein
MRPQPPFRRRREDERLVDIRRRPVTLDGRGYGDRQELLGLARRPPRFRHREKDNEAILRRLIARGRVYLSNATVRGHFALRACFVNHRSTDDDVREIVSEVIAAADEIND